MKFKIGDPVLIFKCPGWEAGGVGIVTDYDTTDPKCLAYLVKDVTVAGRDMWTKESCMFKLRFDKPSLLEKVRWILNG